MDSLVYRLKALADPVRLRILDFLLEPVLSCCSREDGVCACDLETFLGLSQPTVSHHMKLLVQAELVTADKRGRWVYYALDRQTIETVTARLARYIAPVATAAD
ncbi:hypothetical protein BH24DEI1_BH24DEI1_03370 [soil metagenome]|jgi:ArsR family transcriptional regulator|nr:metalloregulator ArsR/SmtB family transcription factor [Deinococcota bacterium]